MKCLFLDGRTDFISVLSSKLGDNFVLIPAQLDVLSNLDELEGCDVVVVGISGSETREFEALQRAALNEAGIPVVAFLRVPDRELTREIMASGAYDVFAETSSMDELRIVLRRAARYLEMLRETQRWKASALSLADFEAFFGSNPKMLSTIRFASKVARTDASILITGETGTGKELLARAIHKASSRAEQPFVAVACASLPETLIEAELFGHEKGAFTGATNMRRGRFEVVGRGTLFLDEIGELSLSLQVKLLRVLQENVFERLGSNQQRAMEARVVCATNRDLKALARSGEFRSDLYYRLNTIHIEMPPLRERRDDISLLAHHFLREYATRHKGTLRRLSPAVLCALNRYSWPGNVRELQHAIEHAVVLSEGPEAQLHHLPGDVVAGCDCDDTVQDSASFEFQVRTFKRDLIRRKLVQTHDNKVQAARSLRISRSSLHRLMEELDVRTTPKRAA